MLTYLLDVRRTTLLLTVCDQPRLCVYEREETCPRQQQVLVLLARCHFRVRTHADARPAATCPGCGATPPQTPPER
eukprot:6214269-Pleurochrysis_carterae.AAC.6